MSGEVDAVLRSHRLAVAVGIALVVIGVVGMSPTDTRVDSYTIRANVTHDVPDNITLGVSVDSDLIDFGTVPVGELRVEKQLTLQNNEAVPVTMHVSVTGPMADRISVTPQELRIPAGQTRTTTVTLRGTDQIAPAVYTGELVIHKQVPLYRRIL